MKRRIFISTALFLATLFLPYWIYAPFIVVATVFVSFYWEAVVLGFLIDILYGGSTGFHAPAAITALVLVVIMMPLRERVRWHPW